MGVRKFLWITATLMAMMLVGFAAAAQEPEPVERVPVNKNAPPPKDNREKPPRSDTLAPDESSSKETRVDIAPPSSDAKEHPEADIGNSGYDEFHPWDPHKAMKSIEVGDFYFKRENYQAAASRYREALDWKPRDAEATYKLATALEKSGSISEALDNYREYLMILPGGPFAAQAHAGVDRLKNKAGQASSKAPPPAN